MLDIMHGGVRARCTLADGDMCRTICYDRRAASPALCLPSNMSLPMLSASGLRSHGVSAVRVSCRVCYRPHLRNHAPPR
jgi:hypothetical protein